MHQVFVYELGRPSHVVELSGRRTVKDLKAQLQRKDCRLFIMTENGPREADVTKQLSTFPSPVSVFVLEKPPSLDQLRPQAKYELKQSEIEAHTAYLRDKQIKPGATGGLTTVQARDSAEEELQRLLPVLHRQATLLQKSLATDDANTSSTDARPEDGSDSSTAEAEEEVFDPASLVHSDSLAQLMAMGFPQQHCIRALIETNMDTERALDYILMHTGDAILDRPITPPPKPVESARGGRFTPDAQAFRQLRDMGFEEDNVLAALELTHNNSEAACDLLLNGVDVKAQLSEMTEEDGTIKHMLKELYKSRHFREAMKNPRFLDAVEASISNHHVLINLKTDTEIGPGIAHLLDVVRSFMAAEHLPNEQHAYEDEGRPSAVTSHNAADSLIDSLLQGGGDFGSLMSMILGNRGMVNLSGDEDSGDEDEDDDENDDAHSFSSDEFEFDVEGDF